jgi:hypothetical protein
VLLESDDTGNTYQLINSVLAGPNRDFVKVFDWNHSDFGNDINVG